MTKKTRRHKAIRVLLTEKCNASCANCLNSRARTSAEFSQKDFKRLSEYLINSGFNSLKIMGGEPTVNSNFFDLIKIAQSYFYGIHIFTNAINDVIKDIKLNEHDSIIYNMNFCDLLTEDKLVLSQPGGRCLKYQINKTTNVDKLIENILHFRKFAEDRIYPSFTFDCTYNIFKDKDVLLPMLFNLENRLNALNIKYGFDHKLPSCFYDSKYPITYPSGLCRVETSGLIDANLNLHYCNQHNDIVCSLLDKDGAFIDWSVIKNYLLKYYYKTQIELIDGYCGKCGAFGEACNGGCWGHFLRDDK